MENLEYPFDGEYILKKSKSIRRQLLADERKRTPKKIAILGGSTTHDIVRILELFLLNYGILPSFYESEYNQYYNDAMFDPEALEEFSPDIIYIHTGYRNIINLPTPGISAEEADRLLSDEYARFEAMWEHLSNKYHCPIIQNNFEYPYFRVMGNYEGVDASGTVRFVNRLNELLAEYINTHNGIYLHDINYLSASYGLDRWSDPAFWNMYKYQMSMKAIPEFAYSLSHIIKSICGLNKKAFALDLDNTLWGGIVGDDGPEGLEIGQETALGETFCEFQEYLKKHKNIGVILNVDSKNEEANALAGLNHPSGVLRPDDFIEIRANWDPKDRNLCDIANSVNLGVDAFVFVDDNPAERMIVREQIPGAAVPDIGSPEHYIRRIDKNGYFEVISLSKDDKERNAMYKANSERKQALGTFSDYREYLLSLEMKARIAPFEPLYYSRISQLSNKSNQFNLTTLRCTETDIEKYATSDEYITLYGQLGDKFGDNGIVTLLIGRKDPNAGVLHMDMWLMSCRVLKRDMECAMLDAITERAKEAGLSRIYGYYYPTAKNGMVKEFYKNMGFTLLEAGENGSTVWELDISGEMIPTNTVINVSDQL